MTCSLEGQSPGEMIVTAELGIVVLPPRTLPGPITWNDDGTPQMPDDVIWFSRERLEHRVEVVEKYVSRSLSFGQIKVTALREMRAKTLAS